MTDLLLVALVTSALAAPVSESPSSSRPLECIDPAGRVLPSATTPLRVGGDVTKPEIIKRVAPDLSELRDTVVTGTVIVEAVIDRDGKICAARLLRTPASPFADAHLAAIRQWRFKPATLNGTPVAVYFVLTAIPHPQ